MNVRKKIVRELIQMSIVPLLLAALGIYAHEFVISGLMAKPELNFTIIGVFLFSLALAYSAILGLFDDSHGIDSIRTDYMRRRAVDPKIFDSPARVFGRPKLLGYSYRLITEELQSGSTGKRLPQETLHLLISDIDQRVAETRATLGYFGGLLILLGLLGAFMGLMKTVHSVSDLIGSIDITGSAGAGAMAKMIEGMKAPLNGMSVGFSSSLFGLLFSLALGLVDRFLINAMKAVRNEFEATLVNLAQLETHEDAVAGTHRSDHHAAGDAGHSGPITDSSDEFLAIRVATDRLSETVTNLSASLLGAITDFRQRRERDPMHDALQRGFDAIAVSQRDMAQTMGRLADAMAASADAKGDADYRICAALERQIELLAEIATHNQIARSIAFAANSDAGAIRSPPGNLAGTTQIYPVFPNGADPEHAPLQSPVFRLWKRALSAFGDVAQPASDRADHDRRPITRGVNPQILRALYDGQNLTRGVLRRLDEDKREDRRIVRELARRQEALVTEIAELARQVGDVMRTHDVAPRDRLDEVMTEIASLKRAAAHDLTRLEAQIAAARRTSERTELAAQSTATKLDKISASPESLRSRA